MIRCWVFNSKNDPWIFVFDIIYWLSCAWHMWWDIYWYLAIPAVCDHYMMVILLEGLRLYTYVPLLYVVCVMQKMMFQKPKKWNILHGTFCMVTFCMEHFTWQKISTVSMLGTKQRTWRWEFWKRTRFWESPVFLMMWDRKKNRHSADGRVPIWRTTN